MIIDCESCSVRGGACADCVITTLLTLPQAPVTSAPVDFDDAEQLAVGVLADAGLLPPLRLVPSIDPALRARMHHRRRSA